MLSRRCASASRGRAGGTPGVVPAAWGFLGFRRPCPFLRGMAAGAATCAALPRREERRHAMAAVVSGAAALASFACLLLPLPRCLLPSPRCLPAASAQSHAARGVPGNAFYRYGYGSMFNRSAFTHKCVLSMWRYGHFREQASQRYGAPRAVPGIGAPGQMGSATVCLTSCVISVCSRMPMHA